MKLVYSGAALQVASPGGKQNATSSPVLQGYLAYRNTLPAQDHDRAPDTVLPWDPSRGLLLISEVPLHTALPRVTRLNEGGSAGTGRRAVQGYLAHKKPPHPQDRRRTMGIVLL